MGYVSTSGLWKCFTSQWNNAGEIKCLLDAWIQKIIIIQEKEILKLSIRVQNSNDLFQINIENMCLIVNKWLPSDLVFSHRSPGARVARCIGEFRQHNFTYVQTSFYLEKRRHYGTIWKANLRNQITFERSFDIMYQRIKHLLVRHLFKKISNKKLFARTMFAIFRFSFYQIRFALKSHWCSLAISKRIPVMKWIPYWFRCNKICLIQSVVFHDMNIILSI